MMLRRKTIIIFTTSLAALLLALYVMQHSILGTAFEKMEADDARRNVARALNALTREARNLEATAIDWAEWDDTFEFAQGANADYVENNLADQTFVDLGISLFVVLDAHGNTLFAKSFDEETGSGELGVAFDAHEPGAAADLWGKVDSEGTFAGVAMLPAGATLVAVCPILPSSGEGPPDGALVMGRWLNASAVGQLAQRVQFGLELRPVAGGAAALQGWPNAPPASVQVRALNEREVEASTLLRDVFGRPALTLSATLPRTVHLAGTVSFQYLAGTTFLVVSLFFLGVYRTWDKQVVVRVDGLGKQVCGLSRSGDLSARVSLRGHDELNALAGDINAMLDNLQKAQDALRQRQCHMDSLAMAEQVLLNPRQGIDYPSFLEALGRGARADRAYVLLQQRAPVGQPLLTLASAWSADGNAPAGAPFLENLAYAQGVPQAWMQSLTCGDVVQVRAEDMPAGERAGLEAQGVGGLLLTPLHLDGSFLGFLGFDRTSDSRPWDSAEVDTVRVAAGDLAQALKHARDEAVQRAIYRISEAAHSADNLAELYKAIHTIVGELMPADNFYFALYDPQRDVLDFAYFVDQYDQAPQPKRPGRGLTEHVLRSGEPLLAAPDVFEKLVDAGEVESIGAPSIDWLGVPLKARGETFGVLVVQTYTEGMRYTEQDKHILVFVSHQVAAAIERQRANKALRQSEIRYRTIFETTGTATAIVAEDTSLSLVNQEFAELAGFSVEELQGKKSWPEFVLPEDLDRMKEYHRLRRVDPGLAPRSYEAHFVNRYKQPRDVLLAIAMIPGTRQSVVSVLDISARRHSEQERERLQAQLRQLQKMEAVGLLAGGVAHDFNNLLTVIQGNAELGLNDLAPEAPLYREMGTILRAARRGASLTQQLLAFSRRQLLSPQAVDLNALIGDFSRMLGRLIGADVELKLNLASNLRPILGDAGALDQVLMNLALNARDAMPQGGTLCIETADLNVDDAFLSSHPVALVSEAPASRGPYVRMSLADSGHGMSPEIQAHLFEPFFTTKDVGKGTGLGLSVVYGIVQQHHGWIQAHSTLGEGTRFDIFLPASDGHIDLVPRPVTAAV